MSACPICGFSPDGLSPADGVAALRSFPRRFGELVAPDDPERQQKLAVVNREAAAAAAEIAASGEDLRRVLTLDQPELGGSSGQSSVDLETVVAQVAELAEGTHANQWRRTGRRGGETATALDVLAEAVHAGAHHLQAAERAVT